MISAIYNPNIIVKNVNTDLAILHFLAKLGSFEGLLKIPQNGEDVLISGFGKFCVKEKGARTGRNPATGKEMALKKRRVVTFKYSGSLRDRINQAE